MNIKWANLPTLVCSCLFLSNFLHLIYYFEGAKESATYVRERTGEKRGTKIHTFYGIFKLLGFYSAA